MSDHQTPPSEAQLLTKFANSVLRDFGKFLRDMVLVLLVIICIRSCVVAAFRIDGPSMENTYFGNEFIAVNRFSYLDFSTHFDDFLGTDSDAVTKTIFGFLKNIPIHIWDPNRWDIVVLRPHLKEKPEYYIKRVIWLPGETIRISDGDVFIKKKHASDFVKIHEPYLSSVNAGNTYLPSSIQETDFLIPEGSYWVMGDNRLNSSDSRNFFGNTCAIEECTHFLPRWYIIGKVLLDFGHFSIFNKDNFFKWERPPRIFNTPKDAVYPELENR